MARQLATARQRCCFDNALAKQARDGGTTRWGWTVHAVMTVIGAYGWINHHGVWVAPSGELIDVTPFPSMPKDVPSLDADRRVIFIPEDEADPWIAPGLLGTLPQRRFSLEKNPRKELVEWIRQGDARDARQVAEETARALLELRSRNAAT